MKHAIQGSKKLNGIIKKFAPAAPPEFPDRDDSVAMLVQSFLMWEATTDKAMTAYQRLLDSVVDFNDLRVSMPFEIVEIIGARYPLALERSERLRATLRDVYLREHIVNFDGLKDLGKREIKKYFDSLDGITPYIAGRVLLISFGVHGLPVDEQLRVRLIEECSVPGDMDEKGLANWLSRQIKADDSLDAHFTLQAWMDAGKGRTGRSSAGKKKTTGKKNSGSGNSKSSNKKTAANSTN